MRSIRPSLIARRIDANALAGIFTVPPAMAAEPEPQVRISLNPITRFGVFDHPSVRASGSGVPVIFAPV